MKVRHFKGGLYEVVTVAKLESDPTVQLVIYKSLESGLVWARPWEDFFGTVEKDWYSGPRFEEINEVQD